MIGRGRAGVIALIAWVATAPALHAATPQLIRYQGRLADNAGVPLHGTHDVDFAVYDAAWNGTAVWSENRAPMQIVDGIVDVLLGEITPLPSDHFTGLTRWLEITVDGTVLGPRQRMSSVPYAHAADRLGDKTLSDVLTLGPPVGAIIQYFGASDDLPANWKLCDGSIVVDPDSPFNGKALPDLRGRNARGELDTERDIAAVGAAVGGSDDLPAHSHTVSSTGNHTHVFRHTHDVTVSTTTDIIAASGADPGLTNYWAKDDGGHWGSNAFLATSGGTNNEGQHRHILDFTVTSATPNPNPPLEPEPDWTDSAGSHSHVVSGGGVAGANMSRYVSLHFIIRIK